MLNKLKGIYNFYVERYKKRFLYCFAVFYGLVIIGMVIGVLYPPASTTTGHTVGNQLSTAFPGLFQAIDTGNIIGVTLLIFGINSIGGSFLYITMPNMIGLGTLIFIFRPLLWGLIYAPVNPSMMMLLIFVIPTLILEGTAYVIAFTASLDLVLALIKPKSLGETSRVKAWVKAWIYNFKAYALVLIVLFMAAVVESVTLVFLVK